MKMDAHEKELLDSVVRCEWKSAKGDKRERARIPLRKGHVPLGRGELKVRGVAFREGCVDAAFVQCPRRSTSSVGLADGAGPSGSH